jgi:cytoskeleton protein RodZ
MTEENTQTQTDTQPSLGQTLKAHRVKANVTLDALSGPLKLSVVQLQRLENDEFKLLGPATFVKGYIKNYCREIHLDSAPILALLPVAPEPQKPAKMQSFSKRTEKEANDSRLMFVSYLILAVVIGSSAVWWWQNSTPIEEQTSNLNAQNTLRGEQQNQETLTRSDNITAANTHASLSTVDNPNTQLLADEPLPSTLQISEEPEATSSRADLAPTNPANLTALPRPQNESTDGTIVMVFSDDSWVEIHDAKGDKVAFGVKKAGYTMTVNGLAPFSVVLGKHNVVNITFNGEPVDISAFPQKRLAKFKLPLAE